MLWFPPTLPPTLPLNRSNGRLARLECCSFFFPLAVKKSAESGEDTTFKYMDTYTHVSDRSRGADDDEDEEEGKNEYPLVVFYFLLMPIAFMMACVWERCHNVIVLETTQPPLMRYVRSY